MRATLAAAGLLVLVVLVMLAGCSPSESPPASGAGPLHVVTTSTVFADLVQNVGGDLVAVTSLAGKNADVHTFEASPADLQEVARARLLVMNGLGLDDWLEETIENAATTGTPLVKLAVDLPGVDLLPGEDPGTQNPHLWMDPAYARLYVDRIAAALQAADPANAGAYEVRATAYAQRLAALDARVRATIATIPEANRKLVMFHDAFPYFARAYGITIVGVAVEAPGQEPSAGDIAALVDAIRAAGVKAIFSETQFPTQVVDQLAAETGATVVANLYDDALGDPPITSYEALIEWDADQLASALR